MAENIESAGNPARIRKRRMRENGRLANALGTALGLGHVPYIPGTFASLVTAGGVALLHRASDSATLLLGAVLVLLLPASIWASARIALREGKPDPSHVVIDEVVGQIFCLLWVPFSWTHLVLGFVAFRVFDILKPFPIKKVERLRGGMGIVCDDLIAGLYAGLLLRIVYVYIYPS